MREVLIIGYGLSGKSAAKLALIKGYKVYIFDEDSGAYKSQQAGCTFINSIDELCDLHNMLVVLSPGVDFRDEKFSFLKKFEIISEVSFAMRWLKGKKIAVTGTNGKSTTVALISHILNCEGIKAVSCGNYGLPLSSVVIDNSLDDYIKVIELSSFQLERIENVHFDVSLCLDITEDHLNRYDSFKEYRDTKINLFLKNHPANHLIIDKKILINNSKLLENKNLTIIDGLIASREINIEIIENKITKDIDIDINLKETSLSYPHDKQNLLYAICACFSLTKHLSQLKNAILTYKALPYRLELISITSKGLKVINDSKSSSSDSVLKALDAFEVPLILIIGGRNKNNSFLDLKEKIKKRNLKLIVFGESSEFLEQLFSEEIPLLRVHDLKDAVDEAFKWVEQEKVLLFSPGCESFDQFLNYRDRGEKFNDLVRNKIKMI